MEESTKRKQAEEEIAQIYHPENQAQKVLLVADRKQHMSCCVATMATNVKKDVEQPYRLLVASRLCWLPYPGFRVKVSRFSEILGRSLSE
jgi:hypothetical protein